MHSEKIAQQVKSVMLGHAVADALGVPVEFQSRERLAAAPVTDMRGFGTYPYPAGCWSDDTSMSLAALDSLCGGRYDPDDIMEKFGAWYYRDDYTPTGTLFDIGNACRTAIENYFVRRKPASECGLSGENSNGNGSLMRIHPFVLYAYAKNMPFSAWMPLVERASVLTHAHDRSKVGCGIYACILTALLDKPEKSAIPTALARAEEYYRTHPEITHYRALFSGGFADTEVAKIKSGGYVVDTLLAAVWCLLTTAGYRECVLKAVNLGEDTDTVAAVAGGLAGALYGYDAIPHEWLSVLKKRTLYRETVRASRPRVDAGVNQKSVSARPRHSPRISIDFPKNRRTKRQTPREGACLLIFLNASFSCRFESNSARIETTDSSDIVSFICRFSQRGIEPVSDRIGYSVSIARVP